MSLEPLGVLVVDDDPVARRFVADVIEAEPGLELLGTAGDVGAGVALAVGRPPDVALIDVHLPGGGGQTLARELRARVPSVVVIAFSASADREAIVAMLRAGASGYLVKGSSSEEIVNAIRSAAGGEPTISAVATPALFKELTDQLAAAEREAEVGRARIGRIEHILDTEAVEMAFQPIISVTTGRLRGYEALARFTILPVRSPDIWFAEAWECGLGAELELMTARAALRQVAALPPETYMSVNLSPAVVMTRGLREILDGADSGRIVLEMTEHAPVDDYDALATALQPMRDNGVRVSVDDAGAGFASLRHILRLSPEFIKLDVSITRGIDNDRARHALARGLVSFASEIDTRIVGEGVETEAELQTLRELGASCAQGYLLGRPGPLPGATST